MHENDRILIDSVNVFTEAVKTPLSVPIFLLTASSFVPFSLVSATFLQKNK